MKNISYVDRSQQKNKNDLMKNCCVQNLSPHRRSDISQYHVLAVLTDERLSILVLHTTRNKVI